MYSKYIPVPIHLLFSRLPLLSPTLFFSSHPGYLAVKYILGPVVHKVTWKHILYFGEGSWIKSSTYQSGACWLGLCRHRTLQETYKGNKNLGFFKTLSSLPELQRNGECPKANRYNWSPEKQSTDSITSFQILLKSTTNVSCPRYR